MIRRKRNVTHKGENGIKSLLRPKTNTRRGPQNTVSTERN